MTRKYDLLSLEFEQVRQNNPVVYNVFESLYRGELTADESFATLAVLMHEQLEHARNELKNALEKSSYSLDKTVTPSIEFTKGQKVMHVDFGEHYGVGTVLGLSKSKERVHVHFPKMFLRSYYLPTKLVLAEEVE